MSHMSESGLLLQPPDGALGDCRGDPGTFCQLFIRIHVMLFCLNLPSMYMQHIANLLQWYNFMWVLQIIRCIYKKEVDKDVMFSPSFSLESAMDSLGPRGLGSRRALGGAVAILSSRLLGRRSYDWWGSMMYYSWLGGDFHHDISWCLMMSTTFLVFGWD